MDEAINMERTKFFAELKKWKREEVMGLFAMVFLRASGDPEQSKRLMIEAINAICDKEQINKALAHLGIEDKII